MSVLTVLKAQLPGFTAGEREIAEYVLASPEKVVQLSSAGLAKATGRSQSGVVKLCQKLGYRGYQDFKIAVSQATAQSWPTPSDMVHGTIESSDSYQSTIQKLIGSKMNAIQQSIQVNGEPALRRALDAILTARRVQLVGVGASSLVARDFTYKLQKLGCFVLFDADSHIQIANTSTLREGDVILALSYSGASIETVQIAEAAKARGATLISLTGMHPNRLSGLADIQLFLVADEDKVRSSAIASRDAQLAMADLLFILAIQRRPDATSKIQAAEQAVAVLKS
ncbi:MurR/RpiR family transcriptional regulator [Oceanicola sp. S124]|uniref:MurR/RpiR family transcriptional regulator n=1 Tax=Oceanicola sp. S124 TaxID=1042378 RepID=UPI0002559A26|nr:MurR/RpiR family transcriptional regulator [Oceanicola sp. S124]